MTTTFAARMASHAGLLILADTMPPGVALAYAYEQEPGVNGYANSYNRDGAAKEGVR